MENKPTDGGPPWRGSGLMGFEDPAHSTWEKETTKSPPEPGLWRC